MNGRKKRFWLATMLLLVVSAVAVGAWIWWLVAHAPPAQIITLSNGDRYQFAGVTYGTNPMPPSILVRLGNLLPAQVAKRVRLPQYKDPIGLPYFYSNQPPDRPELRVWFKRLGTNAPPRYFFRGRLADENDVEGGVMGNPPTFPSTSWACLDFPVVPRRSREIQCTLYQTSLFVMGVAPPLKQIGSVRIPNPLRGRYPQWQPEPADVKKKAGDLAVRIDDLAVQRGDPGNTKIDVSLSYPPELKDKWVVHGAVLSDATGNSLRTGQMGLSMGFYNNLPPGDWQRSHPDTFDGVAQGTLWPGETAWRLKVELKHITGYTPTELVVFTNVPAPPLGLTNACRVTNTTGGIQYVLTVTTVGSFSSPTTSGFDYELHLELPGKPADMAVDLISSEPNRGKTMSTTFFNGQAYPFDVMLQVQSSPLIMNMNLTFAVQKTRSVEFLVKPPKE